MNGVAKESLVRVFGEIAEVGRKLVETSETVLAILREREAECRPGAAEPAPKDPMPTAKPTALLTQKQIAELLQVGTRTLARLRSDPKAKFPRPTKRTRVLRWRREDVEAWLEARR